MQKDWDKQLIKGRIAEAIFDQMFRSVEKFTVMPFGYESLMPDLVQSVWKSHDKNTLETVHNAPDFALV